VQQEALTDRRLDTRRSTNVWLRLLLRSAERRLHCLIDLVRRDRLTAANSIYQVVQLRSPVHIMNKKWSFIVRRRILLSGYLLPLPSELTQHVVLFIGR
jgi:hypothetical protein